MDAIQRRLSALQHSANGQQRYCELIRLLKRFPRAAEDALLALAVAVGQFVNGAKQHLDMVTAAARECGIKYNRQILYSWRIQRVIHYRNLAQDQSLVGWKTERGDPRVKWSGTRYQISLGITAEEAHACDLRLTVNKTLSRKVARYQKTPEQWRQQTQAASDARSAKSAANVKRAGEYQAQGLSVAAIAKKLSCCTRTVYNYFTRLFRQSVNLRFEPSSVEPVQTPNTVLEFENRPVLQENKYDTLPWAGTRHEDEPAKSAEPYSSRAPLIKTIYCSG